MKILIISDAWKPQLNGVVRTYELMCEELEKAGHEVKVIGPYDFPHRFHIPGYKEIELAVMPYKRLSRMMKEYRADAIHIATEATLGKAARRYCLKNNLPFTTAYHTHFPDYAAKRAAKYLPFMYKPVKDLFIKSLREFHRPACNILIATQSLEDELRQWGFTAPISRLTRGAKLDQFNIEASNVLDEHKRPIALYVGRVAIEKNLEAFLDMSWEGSKVIVGDGPSLAELTKRYPDAIFAGRKEGQELGAYYRAADIFVFPSKTDTFGIVLIEALACGLPIAAYNVTGPKDIVTEPFLGALDDKDLDKAALKALEIKDEKKKRHDYVRDHYTWEAVAKQFIDAIDKSRINNN